MKQTTNQLINEKTNQLIKNIQGFKFIEKEFKETSAKLVNELIELHRIKNSDYSFSNLLQEKELQDYSDVIEMYVPYNINPTITKFYKEGKLNNCDMMVLANTDKEFQSTEKMNKIVTKILTKEIKSKDLIRASPNEIREMIGEEVNELEEERKIVLECIYYTQRQTKMILEHKDIFMGKNGEKYREKLIENFNHLKNAIQFGLKIKLD